MIKFITGNHFKFEEVKTLLNPIEVEWLDMDLHEIQSLDTNKIIEHKLKEAFKHVDGEVLVEDSSFHLECLKGLPGPHIRWFLEALGNEGLVDIAEKLGNTKAEAITIIGYADGSKRLHFFEGSIKGDLVHSKGDSKFGWEPIFLPDGFKETFGEMSREEKHKISMRAIAARKLKDFLEKQKE